MRPDYTHVAVILDRSGSMESIRDDTIGGFNRFLRDQQAAPGTATLTLVQFDTQDPYESIHDFLPIGEVPALTRSTYVPRASTPLLDALGRAINDLAQRLGRLPADRHPEKVVVVVVTDGRENSSREFRKEQVERMIREKAEKDQWQFVFLSADLAAIREAYDLGFDPGAALLFAKTSSGTAGAWASASAGTADLRAKRRARIGFKPANRKPTDDPDRR